MSDKNTELAVAALAAGTVIDHIPSAALFKVAHILGIEGMTCGVTIGNNLPSRRLGRKGIIKVEGIEFDRSTLDRIAVVAPTATVNIIRNYHVAQKNVVELPSTLTGVVRCPNPKCITNNEPMRTRFKVSGTQNPELHCHYCGCTIMGDQAEII